MYALQYQFYSRVEALCSQIKLLKNKINEERE